MLVFLLGAGSCGRTYLDMECQDLPNPKGVEGHFWFGPLIQLPLIDWLLVALMCEGIMFPENWDA